MLRQTSNAVVAQLRESIRQLERPQPARGSERFSSGCPPLDQLLPDGGFAAGSLIEWLAEAEGSGAETLALHAAQQAMGEGRRLVVMDRQGEFYPPAAAALGIDLGRTLVVRAARFEDELWALDQALRCPGVGAALAAVDHLDWRWFRRLQLAAEQGGGLGLLLRPTRVRGQPSWSQVQLWVQPCPSDGLRQLRVVMVRCQGAAPGRSVQVEIDDVTGDVRACGEPTAALARRTWSGDGRHEPHPMSLAAQLAHPKARRRSARA